MVDFLLSPPQQCEKPYTVSQINDYIANRLESPNSLVWVEAEVSDLKQSAAGHCYLRLKDAASQIPAVLWRSVVEKLDVPLENGIAVHAIASIRVYKKGGYYQLDIHKIQPAGLGMAFVALERLRKKLEAEGLFSLERKRPIPAVIRTLGVITSKQGAAVRDILKVVATRAPQVDVLICHSAVQGEQAPLGLCTAIRHMNEHGVADCIILGRGGGSVEDLWPFNDERVVRAIAGSRIPIISAVGHEIDVTLSDFVADCRAPTPSAAAEMAVPDTEDKRRYFQELYTRFLMDMQHYWESVHTGFHRMVQYSNFKQVARHIEESTQEIDFLQDRLFKSIVQVVAAKKNTVITNSNHLQALSPLNILSRGYSIVYKTKKAPVRSASELHAGERVHIRFHKGCADADVTAVQECDEGPA